MPIPHGRLIVLDFGGIDGNARLGEVLAKTSWEGEIRVIDPLAQPWPFGSPDALADFMRWMYSTGQQSAASLDYAPLPAALVTQLTERLGKISPGSTP